MTKEIRLLTGRHAGARIKLEPTQMRIGSDDEAHIQISDWDQPAMQLSQHEDASVTISDAAHPGDAIVLEDFKPRRFGNVVLCTGDADAQWPSDIELLETLLAPAAQPTPDAIVVPEPSAASATPPAPAPGKHRRGLRVAGTAGIAVLAIGGAGIALPAVLHPRIDGSLHGVARQPSADDLRAALARLHQPDVTITPQGGRFDVVGLVPDRAGEALVRTTLETIAPGKIIWRIGCVDEITRDLLESLHDPALRVRYLGRREFGVTGVAKDAHAAQATLMQLSADLAPMVTQVTQQIAPDERMPMPATVESLLAVDDLQYVEGGDGTKQFIDSRATAHPLN